MLLIPTPYVCRQNNAEAIEFLEPTINNIFACFKINGLVANSGKSHFLVSLYEKISLKILGSTVKSSPCEELLGITIDSEIIFHKQYYYVPKLIKNLVPGKNSEIFDHR